MADSDSKSPPGLVVEKTAAETIDVWVPSCGFQILKHVCFYETLFIFEPLCRTAVGPLCIWRLRWCSEGASTPPRLSAAARFRFYM